MNKRQEIAKKFSTFLKIERIPDGDKTEAKAKYREIWGVDLRLQAQINLKIASNPNQDETFWSDHFWQAVKDNSDPLAKKHLLAYLEEPCYWSAKSIDAELLKILKLSWEDCFQIAREAVRENWQKIFKNYNSDKGTFLSWAQTKLIYAIQDRLREGREFSNSSDWRLLQCSKKRLKTALEQAGIKEPQFSICVLAWQAFNAVYLATNIKSYRQLPRPTEEQWAAITDCFNDLALPQYGKKTIDEIEKLLQICVSALRAKSQIQLATLDGEYCESLQSEVAEKCNDWYQDSQEQIEYCELSEEMILVIGEAIASLPPDARKMLILEHGLIKFQQKYIAQEFGIPQYTVSRLLSRSQRILAHNLLQSLQQQYDITVNAEMIDQACQQLDGWLNWYFQTRIMYRFLQTTLRLHPQLNQEISLLRWYFGANQPVVVKAKKVIAEFQLKATEPAEQIAQIENSLKRLQKQGKIQEIEQKLTQSKKILNNYKAAIKDELNISETEMSQKLSKVRNVLQLSLQTWLQKTLGINSDSLEAAIASSGLVVEHFLVNAAYAEIK